MKILVIGDIHGEDSWEEIAKQALLKFIDIVFLGDYLDSFDKRPVEQIYCLKKIIAFKKKYADKVTLLLGNHDWAYLFNHTATSGFQPPHYLEYKQILVDNIDLFQMATGFINKKTGQYTLVTHAGLTYRWWNKLIVPQFDDKLSILNRIWTNPIAKSIHEILNVLRDRDEIWWIVGNRRGGFSNKPSPLWADISEFIKDPFPNINQIFGHTASFAPQLYHSGENFYACIDDWSSKGVASMIIDV